MWARWVWVCLFGWIFCVFAFCLVGYCVVLGLLNSSDEKCLLCLVLLLIFTLL